MFEKYVKLFVGQASGELLTLRDGRAATTPASHCTCPQMCPSRPCALNGRCMLLTVWQYCCRLLLHFEIIGFFENKNIDYAFIVFFNGSQAVTEEWSGGIFPYLRLLLD